MSKISLVTMETTVLIQGNAAIEDMQLDPDTRSLYYVSYDKESYQGHLVRVALDVVPLSAEVLYSGINKPRALVVDAGSG